MKSIILLGSSGFIGRSLAKYILTKQKKIKKVFCISRSVTKVLGDKRKIFKIKKDIVDLQKLPEVDGIIYLINSNNPKKSLINFEAFKKLLFKLKKKPKILYLSSGSIYGKNTLKKKISESSLITNKNIKEHEGYKKNYSLEKKILEKEFTKLWKKQYKISIARCFTFVGKEIKNEKYVIWELINAIKTGKKLKIKRANNTYRSYMHTDDMCNFLLQILFKSNENSCKIFNVGSDEILNLKEICDFFIKKFNLKNISYSKNQNSKNIDFYIPSINLIKKKFRLRYKSSSKKAILRTLKYI